MDSYRAIPPNSPVRLAKPTSNLFRARDRSAVKGLDVSGLTGVIAVDAEARTADVAGMCTYEDLVAATLPHALAPLVVPQLKTITLGGAVTGLGIESTSFRNGLPHESVLEMDILTGAGEIVTASPEQHADLFRTFPNSYGTLGYSTRLRIELEPVTPFVALRHLRFHTLDALVAAMDRIIETGGLDGQPVDYLDGVVFSADESYLCVGFKTTTPGPVSDYTGQDIYYRSIQHADGEKHDRLTIHDYLWRWDTDWFWCSRAFGAQNPTIRRFWPRRLRRSSFYWKLVGYDQRFNIADRIEKRNGRRRANGWCRTSRCHWRTADNSSTGSWRTCRSNRSGCARCDYVKTTATVPGGRCIPFARTTPTSTSGSGRRCPSARSKGTPTS
ncbi:FAD linked oxidase domain-containing protein [Mycolicibacterium conceptionense]|uniref:Delta(24)-sterol reductase n=1 Tax=Mycolicibacterium conceptionense TaxID=451644 RepID=A0A0U1DXJ2_9MYCO|nr:FAD linked oxidase domain-containing protein [Mycolicibacterium conceptionense]